MATERWGPGTRRVGERHLLALLEGLGDPGRERLFRMFGTICLHRACTDLEVKGLSGEWCVATAEHVAGAPVEILRSIGCSDTLSCLPCERPKLVRSQIDWRLKEPRECGECPTCLAREACLPRYGT